MNKSVTTCKLPTGSIEATLGSLTILVREKDGYINATRLCKDGGKRFNDWFRLDSTTAFLEVMTTSTGIPADLVEVIATGENHDRGTWVHPDVAVQIANWISPEFAVKVSQIVRRFYTGDLTLVGEAVRQHDAINKTTSIVTIDTVLGKRKAELELFEYEARVRRIQAESALEEMKLKAEKTRLIKEALSEFGVLDAATEQFLGSALKTDLLLLSDSPAAESAPLLWPVTNRAQRLGYRLRPGQDAALGRAVKKAHWRRYGRDPEKKTIFHRDSARDVWAYSEQECRECVDESIRDFFSC